MHWSMVNDDYVEHDVRWEIASVLVSASSELGVPLPALAWFAGESAAERRYADSYNGDRPWHEWTTGVADGDLLAFAQHDRATIVVNAAIDRQTIPAAVRAALAGLAEVGS